MESTIQIQDIIVDTDTIITTSATTVPSSEAEIDTNSLFRGIPGTPNELIMPLDTNVMA